MTPGGGSLSVPGGSIWARMSSISSFCSSNGITLIPNGITPVLPALPVSGPSRLTKACEKYGGKQASDALDLARGCRGVSVAEEVGERDVGHSSVSCAHGVESPA